MLRGRFLYLCLFIPLAIATIFVYASAELDEGLLRKISFDDYKFNESVNYTFAAYTYKGQTGYSSEKPKQSTLLKQVEAKIDIRTESLVYKKARIIVSGCQGLPDILQICDIYAYLMDGNSKKGKSGWKYVSDPNGKESFQNASDTLQMGDESDLSGVGDCDDYAILMSSLIESIGGSTMIVLAEKEGKGAHMYSEVYLGQFGQDDENVAKIIRWLKGKYDRNNIAVEPLPQTREYWLNLDWNSSYPGGPSDKWAKYTPLRIRSNITKYPMELANQKPIPIINDEKNLLIAEELIWFNASCSIDIDGRIINYEWKFGDNSSSSLINVTHIYEKPGSYEVTLNVTDNMGENNSASKKLLVGKPKAMDLTFKPKQPEVGDIVTFNATGMKEKIVNYNWSFDDGEYQEGSDLAVCSHAYISADSYHVNLTTKDDKNNIKSSSVLLVVNNPPFAEFNWDPTRPIEKNKIKFTAEESFDSDGSIESYEWSFGDGTNATGISASHSYDEGGDYLVSLSITDNLNGINNSQKLIHVDSPPTAYFSFDPYNPGTNEIISFDATLSSDPDNNVIKGYEWNFGDGGVERGRLARHKFQKEGNYTVNLTVIDDKNLKDNKSLIITVKNVQIPPAAFPIYAPEEPTTDDIVIFDASWSSDPDGQIRGYRWELNDGTKNNETSFAHKFEKEGEYSVKLTVIDENNLSDTQFQVISVRKPPSTTSFFSIQPESPEAGQEIIFNASSSKGDIDNYLWDFGDDTPGKDGEIVKHIYLPNNNTTNIYNVTLSVINKEGEKIANSRKISVAPPKPIPLVPDFTYQPDRTEAGKEVTFNASSSKGLIMSYEWDFGDDSPTVLGKAANHVYSARDQGIVTYEVILKLTDIFGNKRQISREVSVSPPPSPPLQPVFSYQPQDPITGQEMVFDAASSQGAVNNYLWDFGDGSALKDDAVVKHAFTTNPNSPKTYDVTLTVADKAGKKYPLTKKVTVVPPQFPTMNSLWIEYNNQKQMYLHCPIYSQIKLIAYSQGGQASMIEQYPDKTTEQKEYTFNYGRNEITFGADRLGDHILGYNINGMYSNIVVIYVVEQGQVEELTSPMQGSFSSQPNSALSSYQAQPYYLDQSDYSGQSFYPAQSSSSFPSHYPGQSSYSQEPYYPGDSSSYSVDDWFGTSD
jgi:PKD repeat protein